MSEWPHRENTDMQSSLKPRMEPGSVARSQGSGLQQLREAFSQSVPRKRTYPYESATSVATSDLEKRVAEDDSQRLEENGRSLHRKRSRINEWPLKNTFESGTNKTISPKGPRGKRKAPNGLPGKRKTGKRISKFQEGSLNDKPSHQPPPAFIGAEDAMEHYHNFAQADEQKPATYDAGIEARPSGTFGFGKFGKAVANVFSGFWKDKESSEPPPNLAEIHNRKAEAEEAYSILKAQGFKGTSKAIGQLGHQNPLNERRVASLATSIRDPKLGTHKAQPFSPTTLHPYDAIERLQPPSTTASRLSISPMSAVATGKRSSSLHFRTPSFQSLKKVKSQVHIPSISRSTDKLPDQPLQQSKQVDLSGHGLRRQPSKKDLVKHEKLSKKVSNLESKLEVARRDLEKSMKGAPPVPNVPQSHARKPFTPGGLASLPSESLLTPQPTSASIPQSNTEIYGSSVVSREPHHLLSPSRQLNAELKSSCKVPSTDKYKATDALVSSGSILGPDTRIIDHAYILAAQAAKTRRNSSLPASNKRPSSEAKIPAGAKKLQRKAALVAPDNSPVEKDESPPPLPTKATTVDEADRPRPDSPFLGRPVAISPKRSRSKTQKRKTSPSPNNTASASKKKKAHFNIHDDELDTALTPDNTAGNRQKMRVTKGSPAPRAVQIKAARAKAVKVSLEKGRVSKSPPKEKLDKPLPKIQKQEEFVWDEDIF